MNQYYDTPSAWQAHWPELKRLFRRAFQTSMHYSIASVNEDGQPHITPIGSLILDTPGHGYFFEEFTWRLPRHGQANPKICVLAVNSSRWFWLRSLLAGRFSEPPAIRLYGRLGEARPATEQEIARWQRRVRLTRFTRGYATLWKEMGRVRDIEFTDRVPVHIGEMTRFNGD